MPPRLSYPGVYVEEISSGVHPIAGVATAIAAFVGYTSRGPDNAATRIFSFADFERQFGGLAPDSELSYAVQQFFSNGGTDAYIVRVPRKGAKPAALVMNDGGAAPAKALSLAAHSTGTWAKDLIASVDYEGLSAADTMSFNLTLTNVSTGASETFSNVSAASASPRFVKAVVNDPDTGSALVAVADLAAAANGPPAVTGAVSGAFDPTAAPAAPFTDKKDVGLSVKLDADAAIDVLLVGASDPSPASYAQIFRILETKLTRALQANYPGAQVFASVARAKPDAAKPNALRVVVQAPGHYDAVVTFDKHSNAAVEDAGTALKLTAGSGLTEANVGAYWFGGTGPKGAQASVTKGDDGSGLPGSAELVGDETFFTGVYALEKADLFNILCIPDATRAKVGDPNAIDSAVDPNAIYAPAMDYCLKRRAFLLIDAPPAVNDVATAINWKTNVLKVHEKNGAAYFPRLRLPDPLNQMQLRTFAPSGVVAGLYARIDGNRGVWKAPAGIEATLSGVQKLVYSLTDAEHGAINPLGLNCFRNFPIYGAVTWGARTLVGSDAEASEWKYVPVRRFALFLEESLYRGLKWVVFEPNDEPLWAQIRLNVGSFMHNLFRQGALQGKTPDQAYFVRCDSSTTTQADIDLGVVNIKVGFAPLKPAEFVVLQIQQMAGQIET
jgi:phage tail sheath protein FI